MIVWGGASKAANSNLVCFADGACYDPERDAWRPMTTNGAPKARVCAQALWTGTEFVVWGGCNDAEASGTRDPRRYVGTGARYNPETDHWTELPIRGAPTPRMASAAVWTGRGVLLFGGWNGKHLNDLYFLPLEHSTSSQAGP